MSLVPAKCPECGGNINIDPEQRLGICEYCEQPFVVQEAIQNFNTTYNVTNNTTINTDNLTIEYPNEAQRAVKAFHSMISVGQKLNQDEQIEKAISLLKQFINDNPSELEPRIALSEYLIEFYNRVLNDNDVIETYFRGSEGSNNCISNLIKLYIEIVTLGGDSKKELLIKLECFFSRIHSLFLQRNDFTKESCSYKNYLMRDFLCSPLEILSVFNSYSNVIKDVIEVRQIVDNKFGYYGLEKCCFEIGGWGWLLIQLDEPIISIADARAYQEKKRQEEHEEMKLAQKRDKEEAARREKEQKELIHDINRHFREVKESKKCPCCGKRLSMIGTCTAIHVSHCKNSEKRCFDKNGCLREGIIGQYGQRAIIRSGNKYYWYDPLWYEGRKKSLIGDIMK